MRGVCDKKTMYKYAVESGNLIPQHPLTDKFTASSFSCVALSDEYLAVGTEEKLLIFATRGRHAGRLLVSDNICKASITKLCFSNDGTQLAALVVVDDKNEFYEAARIYTTETFRPRTDDRLPVLKSADVTPAPPVKWNRDYVHSPSGIAFSRNGNMVAICTTHSQARANIRILKKEVSTWRLWGTREVAVHISDHREWHGLALTGISL